MRNENKIDRRSNLAYINIHFKGKKKKDNCNTINDKRKKKFNSYPKIIMLHIRKSCVNDY